jgi:hypothetical protein
MAGVCHGRSRGSGCSAGAAGGGSDWIAVTWRHLRGPCSVSIVAPYVRAIFDARMPTLRKRETTITAQLAALDAELHDAETYLQLAENLEGLLARLAENAQNLTVEERQRVVREILIGDGITIPHTIPTPTGPDSPSYLFRGSSQDEGVRLSEWPVWRRSRSSSPSPDAGRASAIAGRRTPRSGRLLVGEGDHAAGLALTIQIVGHCSGAIARGRALAFTRAKSGRRRVRDRSACSLAVSTETSREYVWSPKRKDARRRLDRRKTSRVNVGVCSDWRLAVKRCALGPLGRPFG